MTGGTTSSITEAKIILIILIASLWKKWNALAMLSMQSLPLRLTFTCTHKNLNGYSGDSPICLGRGKILWSWI